MANYNEYDKIQLINPADGNTPLMPCTTPKQVLFPDGTTLEENFINIPKIESLTQEEYEALEEKIPDTLYLIVEE